uniref:UDP glucuronosyltransferase 1 family, polypeptide A1 n=1 Tax=Anabas testudineus TaxID=64144 RepID=A0A7N6ASG8_ANATE
MSSGVWFSTLGFIAWLCCLGLVQGGKVLVVPADGSHWLSMKILVKELYHRGHEILVLVPETSSVIHGSESYKTEVYPVPYTKEELYQKFDRLEDDVFRKSSRMTELHNNVQLFIDYTSIQVNGCERVLNNQSLMTRLRKEVFDLVLTDPVLPCSSILANVFSIPTVYFLRGLLCDLDLQASQCPSPPSYVPAYFSGNTDIMTFPQRVTNMAMSFMQPYVCKMTFRHFDDLVSRYLENKTTYKDLLSHGAVWLLRYDFTFEWPRPLMPNMVSIGGINCAKKAPLPAEFVNGPGEDGFIIFTLGSMLHNMPEEKAKQFFDMLLFLVEVLWRYTGWLPQNDLLGPTPRLKSSSPMVEPTVSTRVSVMLCPFPLFGDQLDNVHRMTHIFTLQLWYFLSYKEKVVELSQVHLDRPVEPLDTAVFWTEFVMRHKGAAHLRVSAHDLNWIQYHSLDVIGFLIIILLTVLFVTVKCCLFCTRKCCRHGAAKRKSE